MTESEKERTMLSIQDLYSFNEDQEISLNGEALDKLGGVKGVADMLRTDVDIGLPFDEAIIEERRKFYGSNTLPVPAPKSWMELFLDSFQDTTLIVLIVAALVSLVIGILEDPRKGWIEGAAILAAVIIVAAVTATNNYSKEAQFRKLNAVKDDIHVSVIRGGNVISLNIKELVAGDIVRMNAGDKVPTDGLLVDGSDVACNESALTGEPDEKSKTNKSILDGGDPFMLSGSTISSGFGRMIVTAVGAQSRWGRTKAKLASKTEDTPLQEKLDTLAGQIGKGGMSVAGATFIAIILLWLLHPESRHPDQMFFDVVLKAFILAVTIVVVAVPEGLPLAVTLSLAYSTQKMMLDNNLIRVLAACETMGNATNICSDKTGTLTQNRMTVVEGWIAGKHYRKAPTPTDMSPSLIEILANGISINTTAALLAPDSEGAKPEVMGNKTEGALLLMLLENFGVDYVTRRAEGFKAKRGDKLFTFSSARKRMTVLQKLEKDCRVYSKGAAEVMVSICTRYITSSGQIVPFDDATRANVSKVISEMASNSLRALALTHRDIPHSMIDNDPETIESEMILDAVFGIKDPLRPDVPDAVRICQEAGIFVRMVTGDNIETAKAIAKECGIFTEGGIAMEGPAFRKLTPAALDEILPKLQVLARSSPDDKHTLVSRLNGFMLPKNEEEWLVAHSGCNYAKEKELLLPGYLQEWEASRKDGSGEVVGVTGDGTNDGPALKAADVGLSMGLSGTDVAKEASDIVILDDNFSSIVKAVMWGRSVFDNIRKFLQFQLTVNVVALTLTFMSAFTGYEPPLNAVMMLWVNLIMDTMGALALGTEPPSRVLLKRRPYKRNASLISNVMWRHIIVQSLYQIFLLTYLLMVGAKDFDIAEGSTTHFTIVFNTFVFCQIFNEFNARSISNEMNVFKGLDRNPVFIGIAIFTIIGQYVLVEYGGEFVKTVGLTHSQWLMSFLLGALSLPLGGLMRLIPVTENENDFAPVSELIKMAAPKDHTRGKEEKQSNDVFSFMVWLSVCAIIPVAAWVSFGDKWMAHLEGVN
mmetsp:Transcript_22674/g.22874  ORF Transcript_22674/g.22874 Transcript_22674/m.22874 type:complete len:1042 (-) Transcript_22674:604-3729(-)|eukprot:CAMPEP_0182431824 /NCGR_PEP_ID=MMETSP1167-20130531/51944_1 /TAXON_ID=2988 /ORGANISM="Mallomonas Sp, Strain CCMP3275" /LENGTH=1041 /DNA_ID=CAMNT_0024618589 /DNA_START=34 /DNA_END=3159 /DNA_ORIENTATION=+